LLIALSATIAFCRTARVGDGARSKFESEH
jgi:hypothetical protein